MPEEVQRKAELTVVLMVFVALTAVGILLVGLTVRDFARARASFSWPTVSGVVLSDPEWSAESPRYAYVVAGQTHESRRVGFFRPPFSGGDYGRLQPGDPVTLHVDPDNPSVAVIEPGGSGLVFLVLSLIAALFVFIGAGGALRTLMNGGSDEWISGEAGFEGDRAA